MSADETKRPVYLNETEAEIISRALFQYKRRCEQNANNALSGYGSCDSKYKSDLWKEKAEQAEELATSVLYQAAGL